MTRLCPVSALTTNSLLLKTHAFHRAGLLHPAKPTHMAVKQQGFPPTEDPRASSSPRSRVNKQGKNEVIETLGGASQLAAADSSATSSPESLMLSLQKGAGTHRGHGSLSRPLSGPRRGTCFHFWVYHLPLPWELSW